MNFTKIILLLSIFAFIGCDGDYNFKDYEKFSKKRWYKENVVSFNFENNTEFEKPNPELLIRFVKGTQVTNLSVNVEIISPDGVKTNQKLNFKLTREGCDGDMCDLFIPFNEKVSLTTLGSYKFNLSLNQPDEFIPNIMYAGVRVNK